MVYFDNEDERVWLNPDYFVEMSKRKYDSDRVMSFLYGMGASFLICAIVVAVLFVS